jgi:hypothetical protein
MEPTPPNYKSLKEPVSRSLSAVTNVGIVVVVLFLFAFFVPIFPDTTASASLFGTSVSVTTNASLTFLAFRCGSFYGTHDTASLGGVVSSSVPVGSGYTFKCG